MKDSLHRFPSTEIPPALGTVRSATVTPPEKNYWKCQEPSCKKKFCRRSLLLYHHQKSHNTKRRFTCPDCHKTFGIKQANQFMYHIDCHDEIRCYSCYNTLSPAAGDHFCTPWGCEERNCTQLFPKRSLLIQHFQYEHIRTSSSFVCPDCELLEANFCKFVDHVDSHQELKKCKKCKNGQDTFAHIVACSTFESNY
jgi:hypothetical protein